MTSSIDRDTNERCFDPPLSDSRPVLRAEVLVAGAGIAGLAAAVVLAKSGFSVMCVGPVDATANGRTTALFEGTLRFLRETGLWRRFEAMAHPIRAIRVVDDTRPFLPVPPITLDASEIGLPALGANIENDQIVRGLLDEARDLPNLRLLPSLITRVGFTDTSVLVSDSDGRHFETKVIVAADGRKSIAREAAGIRAQSWRYPQVAITALVAHRRPHGNRSTEFHTRGGPCTLVPLAGTQEHPNRSSLVWLMTPDDGERRLRLDDGALAAELQTLTRSILGRMRFEAARGFFPMGGLRVNRLASHRIVLVGEAAHAFPPLAAQGLNLSLRDIAQLRATLIASRQRGDDIGTLPALRPYERARRRDVTMRISGVDMLNRSIMTDFAPVDAMRGAGVIAVRLVGPLRRALLREGIDPPSTML